MIRSHSIIFLLLATIFTVAQTAAARASDYNLGPQDKLLVKVYDLRSTTGEAYQWAALNGEFQVGASGAVSLPLLGEVPANGITTEKLASDIASRLQQKIGLAQKPDASVEVIQYRPFYILGAVTKPGEYAYRPGMTVLQALSIAGGLSTLNGENLLTYEKETVINRGELTVLVSNRTSLLARQARLQAEISEKPSIDFPSEMSRAGPAPEIQRLEDIEQRIFDAHRQSLTAQVQALTDIRTLLQSEVNALTAKGQTLAQQLDLAEKELSQVSDLVARKLAVTSRQLDLERTRAQMQSSQLDIQIARLKAQQDMSRSDRDILELRNKYRNDALTEAADVRTKLAESTRRVETEQLLIYQSEVRAPLAITAARQNSTPTYTVTRQTGGAAQVARVEESDGVGPGDVVQVTLKPEVLQAGPVLRAAGPPIASASE